ncbi:hypothetical protein P3T42_001481 [Paraburkholderia sp. GAS38]
MTKPTNEGLELVCSVGLGSATCGQERTFDIAP